MSRPVPAVPGASGWVGLLLALPAALAAAVSAWLAAHFVEAYGGGVVGGWFCGGASGQPSELGACAAVATHPWASFAGYPLAGWGLAFQLVVLAAAVGAAALREPERSSLYGLGARLTGLGTLAALVLAWVMWSEVGALCAGCLAVHLLTALEFAGFTWAHRRCGGWPVQWNRLVPSVRRLARPAAGEGAGDDARYRSLLLAVGWGALIVAQGLAWTAIHSPLAELRAWGEQQVADFHARRGAGPAPIDMARFEDHPWSGPRDAAVSVVVVGDFECAQCANLARALRTVEHDHPGSLRVAFVHAPLSSRCNPAIPTDLHPDACALAAACACASEQGRFDAFHAAVFGLGRTALDRATLEAQPERLGLDVEAFRACLVSGRGAEAVARDLALCRELGLTTTPSLVIEGWPKLGSVHPWMLRELLDPFLDDATPAREGEQ